MKDIIVKENEELLLTILWTGEETEITYNIFLAGRGAKVTFLALLLGKEEQSLRLQTHVHHQSPETKSEIIVKSALRDKACVNFEGLVKIYPGAKGTRAWLAAHMLLLSDKAKGQAIPGLEILENDIKAGHATTVGRINELELFYLQSRGLPEEKAKQLIVEGFLSTMLEQFPKELAEKVRKTMVQ